MIWRVPEKARIWRVNKGPRKGMWGVMRPYVPDLRWTRGQLEYWHWTSYHCTWREALVGGVIAATIAQRRYLKLAALEYGYKYE